MKRDPKQDKVKSPSTPNSLPIPEINLDARRDAQSVRTTFKISKESDDILRELEEAHKIKPKKIFDDSITGFSLLGAHEVSLTEEMQEGFNSNSAFISLKEFSFLVGKPRLMLEDDIVDMEKKNIKELDLYRTEEEKKLAAKVKAALASVQKHHQQSYMDYVVACIIGRLAFKNIGDTSQYNRKTFVISRGALLLLNRLHRKINQTLKSAKIPRDVLVNEIIKLYKEVLDNSIKRRPENHKKALDLISGLLSDASEVRWKLLEFLDVDDPIIWRFEDVEGILMDLENAIEEEIKNGTPIQDSLGQCD